MMKFFDSFLSHSPDTPEEGDQESLDVLKTESMPNDERESVQSPAEDAPLSEIVESEENKSGADAEKNEVYSSDKPLSDVTETSRPEETSDVAATSVSEDAAGELRLLMEKLLNEFGGKLKYDVKKQEQIDRLYQENCAYRDGLVEQCKKHLIQAVIEQVDDAEKQIAHFRTEEFSEKNFKKMFRSFEDVALSLRDMLLERFDVDSWQSDAGTPFDPKCQRSLRTTPTADTALVKTLRRSIRFGYKTDDGIILRPELVDVYIYDAQAAPSTVDPASETPRSETNTQINRDSE